MLSSPSQTAYVQRNGSDPTLRTSGRGGLELLQKVLGEDGDEDILAREAAAVRVLLEVELPVGRGLISSHHEVPA